MSGTGPPSGCGAAGCTCGRSGRSRVEGPLVVARPVDVILSGRESNVEMPDSEWCGEPEFLLVVMSTDEVEPLAVSVVAQTRPRVGRGPALPLLLVEGKESLPDSDLDVILSGRESTVGMSDVSRDICLEPDLLPVVMSMDGVEPLAVPVVALTRSRVEGPLVVGRPVDVDAISRAAVYPDLLSGRVMKSVDPDVGSGDPMSLESIPDADGDACHSVWRELVLDDVVREKFVLVPEVSPAGSMTSASESTFLPALSEVYSPVFLAGGFALDSVGLRVGPSCLRLDPEEALPALLDDRGVTCDVYLGVTPDGGAMEGAPVLEPLEHSVLEKSPVGGFTEGAPVLEPLEHSVLEKSLVGGFTEGYQFWNR